MTNDLFLKGIWLIKGAEILRVCSELFVHYGRVSK